MNTRKEQLAAARCQRLNGRSPRQRGTEKTLAALDWVYRWGWASSSTIERVGGAMRSGLAARLVKAALLRRAVTESGGAVSGVPAAILTLTETGQAEIERHRSTLLKYNRDAARIRQDHLRHYQLAQTATISALENGTITGFLTEREVAETSMASIKQPDVVWLLPNNKRAAVEVELTAKWGRSFDMFILSCVMSLSNHDDTPARFQFIFLISDSPALIKRYQEGFSAKSYQAWRKNDKGLWVVDQTRLMPNWIREKVLCKLI